jgi:hypothetical protein
VVVGTHSRAERDVRCTDHSLSGSAGVDAATRYI